MIRDVLKVLLVVIVLVAVGGFVLGWWSNNRGTLPDSPVQASGPETSGPINTDRARDVGAKIGEATADAANEAEQALETGSITAKIKSKMALDDLVKARNIDVDTNGTVVTLSGVVESQAERQRAMQLARETEGVTSVVDQLRIR
jgi:hyperosmotically inducible periplasmic protein